MSTPGTGAPDSAAWLRECALVERVDLVLLGAAVVIGVLLRTWSFGAIPPGLNQDEASTAYDAFSILRYGVDRNGFVRPLMLVSWGSGMYALASYAAAPFIAMFGLSVFSARLPSLLAGIATIPLYYVLLRDMFGVRTARIGTVLLAISPWHIMIARWGLDSNLFPFVFLAAMVLLVRSLRQRWLLIPACMGFAVALYAYGTAYVVVPIFLILALAYGLRHRIWPVRTILWSAGAFAVFALPIGLYLLINTFGWESIRTPFFSIPHLTGVPRYRTMGNLNAFSVGFVLRAAENLARAIGLFFVQNDRLIWNAIPGFGIMYLFSPLLAFPGLWLLIRKNRRRFDPSFFLLAWWIAAGVLMALVSVNINRANIAMFPFIACTALAVAWLWQYRFAAIVVSMLFGLSLIGFTYTYFGPYRDRAAPAFYASFGEAVREAAAQTNGEICITSSDIRMPYIFALFYNREDPRNFYRTVQYENPGGEFQAVSSFGRYRFGLHNCESPSVLVVTRQEEQAFASDRFAPKRFERYTVLTRRNASAGIHGSE